MWHTGASRKSPNEAAQGTLDQKDSVGQFQQAIDTGRDTGWSDSLVDSVLGFGPRVPSSIPSSYKNFAFRDTLIGFGSRR